LPCPPEGPYGSTLQRQTLGEKKKKRKANKKFKPLDRCNLVNFNDERWGHQESIQISSESRRNFNRLSLESKVTVVGEPA